MACLAGTVLAILVFLTLADAHKRGHANRQVHNPSDNTTPSPQAGHDPMSQWLHQASSHKPNVLFLIVDDLRPKLGCYGESNMITPNIDHLASLGVRFDRAYVQQALCGPSRASFLTGRRPDTTHVFNLNDYWRTVGGNFTTIPQYFKEHGYVSHGVGKIYHPGASSGRTYDAPYSWTDQFYTGHQGLGIANDDQSAAIHAVNETGGKLVDTDCADNAVQWLKDHASHGNQPFFLAVGFHKPHLPWIYPEQYTALYPLSHIHLAQHRHKPANVPDDAWTSFGELRGYQDIANLPLTAPEFYIPDNIQLELRQAYSAAVSYTDAQIGRVLDALNHNGYSQNTLIVFMGDHGWQLGENGEWCKHTNFEVAVRIPMILYVPGVTSGGHNLQFIDAFVSPTAPSHLGIGSSLSTDELVEAVDVFATLTELAGLPVPATCPADSSHVRVCTEGTSLVPLIKSVTNHDFNVTWKDAAYSQYPRALTTGHPVMGYTIRIDQYRYTEWVSYDKQHFRGHFDTVLGRELYDQTADPDEANNLANDATRSAVVSQLSQKLRAGWRQTLHTYSGH